MDELARRFAELADKYGAHVIDAARGAARMEAYSCLAGAAFRGLIAIALIFFARWLWGISKPKDDFDMAADFGRAISGLAIVASAALITSGIWTWVDPWTWQTIQNPDLWIAKKVLKI